MHVDWLKFSSIMDKLVLNMKDEAEQLWHNLQESQKFVFTTLLSDCTFSLIGREIAGALDGDRLSVHCWIE